MAGADLDAWAEGWTTLGLPYDDGISVGSLNVWGDCGDVGSVFVDWASMNVAGDTLISAQFTIVSDADLDAAVHALETLFVTSDLAE